MHKEQIKNYARHAALVTLPILAAIGCSSESKKPPIQTTTIKSESQAPIASQASLLSVERQQLLKVARNNNLGIIFVDVVNFDPGKNIIIDINELNSAEDKVIDKVTQKIYVPNTGQNVDFVESAITIKNCDGLYQIGISTNGHDFFRLQFEDSQTGKVNATFKINAQECFKAITIPVKTLQFPAPNF